MKRRMKLIIAGSRTLTVQDLELILKSVDLYLCKYDLQLSDITEIVSGRAAGADTLGEQFAELYRIPMTPFRPEYHKFAQKRAAPLARNTDMAAYADGAVITWNGYSTGSLDMYRKMKAVQKPVLLLKVVQGNLEETSL